MLDGNRTDPRSHIVFNTSLDFSDPRTSCNLKGCKFDIIELEIKHMGDLDCN